MSAEEARGLLTWATRGPWYVDSSGRGVEYASPDIGAVEVVAWTARGDTKLIAAAPDLAATVIALSEERDRTQEHVIRLTEENVKLLRWQSVAANAHLDHLCAMVTSLAANDCDCGYYEAGEDAGVFAAEVLDGTAILDGAYRQAAADRAAKESK